MPKVCTSATLWPAITRSVARIIADLIRAHCAQDLAAAIAGDRTILFERRLHLWAAFVTTHPVEVGFESFSDEINRALGRHAVRRNPIGI